MFFSSCPVILFLAVKSTLIPVFKHLGEQYPDTLYKLFAINSSSVMSTVWSVIKKFIDPETAAKVNILSTSETAAYGPRFEELGIPIDQLPNWVANGSSETEISIRDAVEQVIAEQCQTGVDRPVDRYHYPPLSDSVIDRVGGNASGRPRSLSRSGSGLERLGFDPVVDQDDHRQHALLPVADVVRKDSPESSFKLRWWIVAIIAIVMVVASKAISGSSFLSIRVEIDLFESSLFRLSL